MMNIIVLDHFDIDSVTVYFDREAMQYYIYICFICGQCHNCLHLPLPEIEKRPSAFTDNCIFHSLSNILKTVD